MAWAVGSTLPVENIVEAKDYSLAEAARPAFGNYGVWFTVGIAIIATASGLLASIFAVSRMLAMLTDMNLIPHRHFKMPGTIQTHTLVYTVVLAGILAAFFDLSRIASLGAIFYLVMDMTVHWGIFHHLRKEVQATGWILLTAIGLDGMALIAFLLLKGQSDPFIVAVGLAGIVFITLFERLYLSRIREGQPNHSSHG